MSAIDDRHMEAWTTEPTSPSTAIDAYSAHCCACNANEIAGAHQRQRIGEDAADERERLRDAAAMERTKTDNANVMRQCIINAAMHCTNELGDHAKAAQTFLERVFEIETKKLADPVMDRFKL